MEEKKLRFSKLPFLGARLCATTGELDMYAESYRRAHGPNVAVRKFTRVVNAGGAQIECYVVVARRQHDTTGL